MKNNLKVGVLLLIGATVVLSGCNNNTNPEVEVEPEINPELVTDINEEVAYNVDSWKEIISDDCVNFFDGCNSCTRLEGEEGVACTKMLCDVYEEPRCTDEEVLVEPEMEPENVIADEESEISATQVMSDEEVAAEPTQEVVEETIAE